MTTAALAYAPLQSWLRLSEPSADPLSEADLAAIWAAQSFPPEALCTVAGQPVRVVHPGRRPGGPGPDFRDAVLVIDGRRVVGDVELHVRASSFRAHGHHVDPAYANIVLHFVYLADDGETTCLSGGGLAPVAALAPWLKQRQEQIEALVQAQPLWQEPCRSAGLRLGRQSVEACLLQGGRRRHDERVARFRSAIDSADAEAALWPALFEMLGAGGDRDGFRRLALVFTPSLARWLSRLEQPEDALTQAVLSLAGLASPPYVRVELPQPLSPPLAASGRPANHPSRRLRAFVRFYLRASGDLAAYAMASVAQAGSVADVLRAWTVAADRGPALLGEDRARELALNVVLPFAAAMRPDLSVRVEELLAQLKPSPIYGKTAFLEANLRLADGRRPVRSALAQQGLLSLLEEWCSKGGCGRCPLS